MTGAQWLALAQFPELSARARSCDGVSIMTRQANVLSMAVVLAAGLVSDLQAEEPALPATPCMGGQVELVEAPNGAIAEVIEDPAAYPRDPEIVLKLSDETWAKVYLSAAPTDELIEGGEIAVTAGDAAEAARAFDLFDRYDPEQAVVPSAAGLEPLSLPRARPKVARSSVAL